jgi:rubrerythrin
MGCTLTEFLAHALAMEAESADRYLELADMMEAHRIDAVSSAICVMTRFSGMHRDEIKARVGAVELPKLQAFHAGGRDGITPAV